MARELTVMPKGTGTLKSGSEIMNELVGSNPKLKAVYDTDKPFNANNFSSQAEFILNDADLRTELYYTLIDKIGLTYFAMNVFYNDLKFLKKDYLRNGDIVEEIAMDVIEPMPYNPEVDWQKALKNFPSVYATMFHRNRRQEVYPVTINQTLLRRAFYSEQVFRDFIIEQLNNLVMSNEVDEFTCMVDLINFVAQNNAYPVSVGTQLTTKEDYEDLVISINTWAKNISFPTRNYNMLGFMRNTPQSRLVLVATPPVVAAMNVYVNAPAYNLDYVRLLSSRTIEVPELPNGVVALLVDERVLQIYDIVYATDYNHNGLTRGDNYFLHVQQIYSSSLSFNAVALKLGDITAPVLGDFNPVTGSTLTKGQTYDIKVGVTLTDAYKQVTYTVTGNTDENTQITPYGLLYIGQNEKAEQITVVATATQNVTKTATYTIKGNTPTIVSVTPVDGSSLAKGSTTQMSAQVSGTTLTPTFAITSTVVSGTTVTPQGLLTIATEETASNLTVRVSVGSVTKDVTYTIATA